MHIANDAREAREIIGQLCVNAGLELPAGKRMVVTKSKSMATEEIGLNSYLEGLGMEVVETDLGERMVQRRTPIRRTSSHPRFTSEEPPMFGTEPSIEAIQRHARGRCARIHQATVGISGANMAIAETRTIVLVTNEGNADLTTTLPPVHIALFGIDKIVATLDDAVAVLRMLPRSATGQTISSYVNWITGPSRSGDIEQSLTIGVHGPRELHCVILDNGREKMLADPLFRDAMTCIRCGACANACPPFMAVGGHQFGGHAYNGPIGLVRPLSTTAQDSDLANTLCTQCNAPGLPCDIRCRGRSSTAAEAASRCASARSSRMWKRPELANLVLRAAAPFRSLFRRRAWPNALSRPRAPRRGRRRVVDDLRRVSAIGSGSRPSLPRTIGAAGQR